MSFRLVDTHCHAHFNAYRDDMDAVIRRALAQGVWMITVGTQSTTSANGLAVAERYDGVWATVGLHPNHLCEQEFWDEDELGDAPENRQKVKTRCEEFDAAYYRGLAAHPKCVAIGECGLDYYRLPPHLDREEIVATQKATCRLHFDVATEADKPVVIHCRDAHADQQAIIREYLDAGKLQRRGVVHCFTGTLDEAQAYIAMGFLISFTGIVTFPPRKGEGSISPLQRVAMALPLESIMVETDAPYLAPVPERGKRNEPANVRHVATFLANLRGEPLEHFAAQTTANAVRLFRLA